MNSSTPDSTGEAQSTRDASVTHLQSQLAETNQRYAAIQLELATAKNELADKKAQQAYEKWKVMVPSRATVVAAIFTAGAAFIWKWSDASQSLLIEQQKSAAVALDASHRIDKAERDARERVEKADRDAREKVSGSERREQEMKAKLEANLSDRINLQHAMREIVGEVKGEDVELEQFKARTESSRRAASQVDYAVSNLPVDDGPGLLAALLIRGALQNAAPVRNAAEYERQIAERSERNDKEKLSRIRALAEDAILKTGGKP